MTVLCIFLLILYFAINRKIKKSESEHDIQTYKLTNKIIIVAIIIFILIKFINVFYSSPEYKDFNNSVNEVMELNKPLVYKCKVQKNRTIKVYLNPYALKELSISERIDAKQKIETTINTIAKNTGYLKAKEKMTVIFKE